MIVGAGFAGAATAWGLARAGLGPGLLLEREPTYGVHASGRNASIARLADNDPLIVRLGLRSIERIRELEDHPGQFLTAQGGVTLAASAAALQLHALASILAENGAAEPILSRRAAVARLPFLDRFVFDEALWCSADGTVDVHALLTCYLRQAREGGFALRTECGVEALLVENGRVIGVRAGEGDVRADVVVDACGAWAGELRRDVGALPLRAVRRHLFVTGPMDFVERGWPYVWMLGESFYCRPEGDGLLLSPCDETVWPAGVPPVDPEAAELLAVKLERQAPSLGGIALRRTWACLRTFAPDRRPLIGPDPLLPGLYHVSGLGGFGVTTSAAVGELAAAIIAGSTPEWIDAASVSPSRFSDRATTG